MLAMMEQRKALSGRKPYAHTARRPGLGARSNTVSSILLLTSTTTTLEEDHELFDDDDHNNNNNNNNEDLKFSSSFTRESLLDKSRNNATSMPSLGVSKQQQQQQSRHATAADDSNLSFADAKKIWMREWRESQREPQEYSFSSFDDDLERSLRQAPSLRSIDTLQSNTTTNTGGGSVGTFMSGGSSRTTVTVVEEEEEPIVVKKVRFSTITIQEYPIIPGVHPGGSGGIPLTIDWEPYDPVSIGLESYERWRVPHLRDRGEMRIPSKHREMILKSLGFSTKTLQASAREAAWIRKQRSKSNSMEHMDKTSEQLEATIRGIQNFLTLGKKKRKERAFLARHVPSYYNNNNDDGERRKDGSGSRRASTPPEFLQTKRTSLLQRESSRRASTPPEVLGRWK